jgi:uncharacterized delta-60 repeat protein
MKKLLLPRIIGVLYLLTAPLLFTVSVLAQNGSENISTHPVTEEWARRFDNKVKGESQANEAAIDNEGNVYITGISQLNNQHETVTLKFSPTGQQLWAVHRKTLNGAGGINKLTVDNAGGVYITGNGDAYGGNQLTTIRYEAATGVETWYRIFQIDDSASNIGARAMATDQYGGVYVTAINNASITGPHLVTIRYETATGEESWVSYYNEDGQEWSWKMVSDMAVDNSGGVYIAGYTFGESTGSDYLTIKYDAATGAEIWSSRIKSQEDRSDIAKAIAVDNDGGVYVTGTSYNTFAGAGDFATIRLDAETGKISWTSFFNGNSDGNDYSDSYDYSSDIIADGLGGVFVTGSSEGGYSKSNDFTTIRYDAATGAQMWLNRYDGGTAWSSEEGRSIAADDQGNIFVTGHVQSSSGRPDFGTFRYDALTGVEIWSNFYNGGGEHSTVDEAYVVLVDYRGGVYAVGTGNGTYGSNISEIVVVRYEADTGEESWASSFGKMVSTNDYPFSLVVDAMGNTYVTGTSYNPNHPGNSMMVTIKYAPNGDELWVNQYDAGRSNFSAGIVLDQNGGLYLTGTSHTFAGKEIVTIRYDALTGSQSWIQRYLGNGNEWYSISESNAITADKNGGIYITGSTYGSEGIYIITIRYDAHTGSESWISFYGSGDNWNWRQGNDIVTDEDNGVYITGYSWRSGKMEPVTIKYEAISGTEIWVSQYHNGRGEAIAINNTGGVYITGYVFENIGYEYLTIGYNTATGEQKWVNQYSGGTGEWNYSVAKDITTDKAGGVYVTGSNQKETGESFFATIRYDAISGIESWISLFKGETNWNYLDAQAIASDEAGGIYITGTSTDDFTTFTTIKYNAVNGTEEWVVNSTGPSDGAVDLAVNAIGNVYVTGYSSGMDTGYDFLTIKYSQCSEVKESNISGNIAVAAGSSSSYSILAPGATSYWWIIEGDQTVSFSGQGTSRINVSWPKNPGVYKVSLDYGSACSSLKANTYVFASDPNAGFVTGGGWFNSPPKPGYELMKENSKTHFNLNAKYKKDGQIVEGNLQLHNNSFRFVASAFETRSLVISGDQAYLTGYGKLNYRGDLGKDVQDHRRFAFLLAVTDGKLNNGRKNKKNKDYFRLKIWEINSDNSMGKVWYDNQVTCSPGNLDHHLEACSPIGGGSIVIHKGGKKGAEMARKAKLEELPFQEEFSVYPVPFSYQINIRYQNINSFEPVKVTLIGIDGRTLTIHAQHLEQTEGFLVLNLHNLQINNGFYILRLQIADEPPIVKKILCQQ